MAFKTENLIVEFIDLSDEATTLEDCWLLERRSSKIDITELVELGWLNLNTAYL